MSGGPIIGGPVTVVTSAPTLTWINYAVSVSSLATIDFGNFTTASSGVLVVALGGRGAVRGGINNIVVGGSTTTIISGSTQNNANDMAAMGYIVVSSAGTYDITATFAAAGGSVQEAWGVGVWLITGAYSNSPYGAAFSEVTATSVSLNSNQGYKSFTLGGWYHIGSVAVSTGGLTWNTATIDATSSSFGTNRFFSWAHIAASSDYTHTETVATATSDVVEFHLAEWR